MRSKEQIWGEGVETYTVVWIDAVQTDLAHCKNDSLCAIKGVSVDGGSVSHSSSSVKPFWWIIFICFTMVDFPDSPEPRSRLEGGVGEWMRGV